MTTRPTITSQSPERTLALSLELNGTQPTTAIPPQTGTLCLEIGGTRIKACVLKDISSYTQLLSVRTYTTETQLFLSKNKISEIFKKTALNPLLPCLESASYSAIAVSLKGPVTSDGQFKGNTVFDVSKDLPAICREQGISAFSLQNDAVSWAAGALAYQTMKGHPVLFPCLAVTLGTGVGVAYCQDQDTIIDIEVSLTTEECPFTRLKKFTEGQPVPYWSPHKALGMDYFSWRFAAKPFQDEAMVPYLSDYNQRFQLLIEELISFVEKQFGNTQLSLMIGGGNSRFIRIPDSLPVKQTLLLSPAHLKTEGLSPEIIQLLGAKKAMEAHLQPRTFPPGPAELVARQEAVRQSRASLSKQPS